MEAWAALPGQHPLRPLQGEPLSSAAAGDGWQRASGKTEGPPRGEDGSWASLPPVPHVLCPGIHVVPGSEPEGQGQAAAREDVAEEHRSALRWTETMLTLLLEGHSQSTWLSKSPGRVVTTIGKVGQYLIGRPVLLETLLGALLWSDGLSRGSLSSLGEVTCIGPSGS